MEAPAAGRPIAELSAAELSDVKAGTYAPTGDPFAREKERVARKREQLDAIEVALGAAGYTLGDFGSYLLWRDRKAAGSEQGQELQLLSIADLLQAPPVEWLIDGVLFDRTFSILGGYTGTGKSLLALTIAKSIADGFPLFGKYQVKRTGPVLIVDQENSHSDLADRLRKMKIGPELPIHFLSFQGVLLDDSKCFSRLLGVIRKLNPVLVIFDSLVRFHHAQENDATEMAHVMGRLREIANLGVGVLAQHHHNKAMGALEVRSRGSSDIIGAADVEYAFYRDREETLTLQTVKSRRAAIEPLRLEIAEADGELLFRCLGTALEQKESTREAILELLEEPQGVADLAVLLANHGLQMSDKSLRGHLAVLTEKGKVLMVTGARNRKEYRRA